MSNNEEPTEAMAITQYAGGGALMGSNAGTLALASMSDQEFSARLIALKRGIDRIATIKREVMTETVDYGVIPGTPKPTLYKAGAEKLADIYGLRADPKAERVVGDGVTAPAISYQVTCYLHLGSTDGAIVAAGMGEANSWEKKHRYRTAERTCPECGTMKSIIKGKDEYEREPRYKGGWLCFAKKGGCGAKFVRDDTRIVGQQLGEVENPDPWDLANTLLKMAEKRAFVDAILRGTASSGLFTQDLEDLPPEQHQPHAASADRRTDAEQRDQAGKTGNGAPAAQPADPPTPADFEAFAKWFDGQLPLTSDAAIPAEARTVHAAEIRDAILSVDGMDTAKLQTLLKALTKRSTMGDQEPQQLRLLYQVVIVRKRAAELAAYAEALSRRGEV